MRDESSKCCYFFLEGKEKKVYLLSHKNECFLVKSFSNEWFIRIKFDYIYQTFSHKLLLKNVSFVFKKYFFLLLSNRLIHDKLWLFIKFLTLGLISFIIHHGLNWKFIVQLKSWSCFKSVWNYEGFCNFQANFFGNSFKRDQLAGDWINIRVVTSRVL